MKSEPEIQNDAFYMRSLRFKNNINMRPYILVLLVVRGGGQLFSPNPGSEDGFLKGSIDLLLHVAELTSFLWREKCT
jgi:hypothetical protein